MLKLSEDKAYRCSIYLRANQRRRSYDSTNQLFPYNYVIVNYKIRDKTMIYDE